MVEPDLYTKEVIVFKNGVEGADISEPVTVVVDPVGNHILQDGNHRAKRAELDGKPIERKIIGTAFEDVRNDPDYKLIKELRIIDKDIRSLRSLG